jgi:Flp pilus assembly protein TadB
LPHPRPLILKIPCDEKKGANETLDKWCKHHQQPKVAKGQNFRQLMVMWSLKLYYVTFVFMTFVFLLVMRILVIHSVNGTYYVVRCPPWLHVLRFGDFFARALMVVC